MPTQVKVFVSLFLAFGLVFFGSACTQIAIKPNSLARVQDKLSLQKIEIGSDIYKKVPFIDNSQSTPPYLSLNVANGPALLLKKQIEQSENISLKDRGESHITVITPPEMSQLTQVLSLSVIAELAHLSRIQDFPFEIVCLGRAVKKEGPKALATYFLVVSAKDLVKLRKSLQALFITRGGSSSQFDPEDYHPHITIGFTDRDLHFQDGIIKNKATCFSEIQLKAQ